ncbi:MAG: Gfo/Idh/MocA family oxidoreductase [Gordonia sp. (in: high G+C Gram-positive bacteria)]|uniref:Gfo/Idh/MocA family protein n=1 Tax=Gordonia sp. (in: high G+C Gram-positive bacteria) TaxID=84139 RepID=UPI0039E691BF
MTDPTAADATPIEPLRIGILGAARIGPDAIIGPAAALGHRIVAVAARDRAKAEAYAARHSIERVVDSYEDLLADPEVELVYNPLANALHGPWNRRVAAAGKALLSEKPFASNAVEAAEVAADVRAAGIPFLEGFHYPFHPGYRRAVEILGDGRIGPVRRVEVEMSMPTPPAGDPRWDYRLAGGAVMDLGCYAIHVFRMFGELIGEAPEVGSARCAMHSDDVDAACTFDVGYPGGAAGRGRVSMLGDRFDFRLTYVGDRGSVTLHDFLGPHRDDRLTVVVDGAETVERVPSRSTYTCQLEAFARAIRTGEPTILGLDDAVANMAMIDDVYRAAGLPPR